MRTEAWIAVQVDHLVPEEVRALVTRIEAEQGSLHILVSDIWGATTIRTPDLIPWFCEPFWKMS